MAVESPSKLQAEDKCSRVHSMPSSVVSLTGSATSRPVPFNQQIASTKRLQHVPAQRSAVSAPCQETLQEQPREAKCTCGKTKKPPNCDGSHAKR